MSEIPENITKIKLSDLGLHGQDIVAKKSKKSFKYTMIHNPVRMQNIQENQEGQIEKSAQ